MEIELFINQDHKIYFENILYTINYLLFWFIIFYNKVTMNTSLVLNSYAFFCFKILKRNHATQYKLN